ncbi:MAG: acetolactate synthase small subunit [Clostridiales Family XIII bacterium]|jgi:acetolactate synthase-1/3 small subunit|nr:acetolactate synthase small subunit [Clostridiales Family XIII bacterium]
MNISTAEKETSNMNERFTVGLVVANRYGVLNRIAGLYNKRGYNIDSLSVGETEDPSYSRMTIVSSGDRQVRTQMVRQLNKLYDVKTAALFEGEGTIAVEHLLIKLKKYGGHGDDPSALVGQYGGKIVETGEDFLVADVTGIPEQVQEFIEKCKSIGIFELCRSGTLALSSGSYNIFDAK